MNFTQPKFIFCLSLFALIFSHQSLAQYDKELWKWESHLPLQNGLQVTQSDDYVYYATQWSIVRVDKEDQNGTFFSKVDGLTDTGISTIAYDDVQEQLIIAYTNGSIDFLKEDGYMLLDLESLLKILIHTCLNSQPLWNWRFLN